MWRSRILILCVVCIASLALSGCTNPLQKSPQAGIQVNTNNIPSAVYLNGNYIDKTPLIDRNLPPGEYHLQIKPDDTQLSAYETVVNLREAVLTVVTWKPAATPEESGGVIYEMEKLSDKNKTELEMSTVPESAIVSVNGQKQQLTPFTIADLPSGEQEYQVSLPSYESQQNTINVVPGYRMYITVKLAKQSATAQLESQVIANITPSISIVASSSATASVAGVMITAPTPKLPSKPSQTPTPTSSSARVSKLAQLTQEGSQIPNTASASVSTSASATTSATVTILKTGYMQNGKEVLRVRAEPSTQAKELGFAETGKEYPYMGEKQLDWIKIQYAGKPGWVNSAFVQINEELLGKN